MAPTLKIVTLQILSALGQIAQANRTLANYNEPSQTTAAYGNLSSVTIPAGTVDNAINLATLFPNIVTMTTLTLADITASPGQQTSFGFTGGGLKIPIAAAGIIAIRTAGALPTIYFNNAGSGDAEIEIGITGN